MATHVKSRSCTINHHGQTTQKLADLPESQAGFWRHRCAACAYDLGVEEGMRRLKAENEALRKKVDQATARLLQASTAIAKTQKRLAAAGVHIAIEERD